MYRLSCRHRTRAIATTSRPRRLTSAFTLSPLASIPIHKDHKNKRTKKDREIPTRIHIRECRRRPKPHSFILTMSSSKQLGGGVPDTVCSHYYLTAHFLLPGQNTLTSHVLDAASEQGKQKHGEIIWRLLPPRSILRF
jgi:hypothetical protein